MKQCKKTLHIYGLMLKQSLCCRSGRLLINGTSIAKLEVESTGSGEAVFAGVTGTVAVHLTSSGNLNIIGNGELSQRLPVLPPE